MTDAEQPRPRWSLRLVWDLFMVWVAFANVGLILFDLSYLRARPVYQSVASGLVRRYDAVKGAEQHPIVAELAQRSTGLAELLEQGGTTREVQTAITEVRQSTVLLLSSDMHDPVSRSRLALFRHLLSRQTGASEVEFRHPDQLRRIVARFWAEDRVSLQRNLELFTDDMMPVLASCIVRANNKHGRPVDRFWMLDLPFLVLFWFEFCTRWLVALRRRTYRRWYFFPIFFWYDLLSLIPVSYFRVLRLLRIVSIYLRLRRSRYSGVGGDVLSRAVAYVANIITEEITDRVSLRLLSEYQQEIVAGTHLRIYEQTIGARRDEINAVIARQIREVVTNEQTLSSFRRLMKLNLDNAVEQTQALRSVPLPNAVVVPIARALGEVLLETVIETIEATMHSERGEEATQAVVSAVLDQLLTGPGLTEIELVAKQVTLDLIEHMKQAVAVKKWAQEE